MELLINVIKESLKVTLFVLLMMIAVDFINVKTKAKHPNCSTKFINKTLRIMCGHTAWRDFQQKHKQSKYGLP